MRAGVKDGHLKAGHEKPFSPAKFATHQKSNMKAAFDYLNHGPEKKKSYRDADGDVLTGPKNFLTNPMKQGKVGKAVTFSGPIEYQSEDYFAKKKLATKERQYHEGKLQEKPFSPRAKNFGHFNSPK